ncbi:MAG: DUF998 domain-containing protein [Ktedonobacteraceae bacterium]
MSVRLTPAPSASSNKGKARSVQHGFLWVGIIAPVLFAAVFTIDGLLKSGYSASDEAISYLDLGTSGWIQRANFILFGLLLLVFLVGYVRRMRPIFGQIRLTIASIFFVISDLGWMMAGFCVPNPYLAPQVPWPGVLHQISVIVAFLPFAIACFILGVKSIRTRGWRIYGGYSLIFSLPLVIFSFGTITYLMNQNMFGNVNSPGSGTMQRVGLLVGPLAWYAISALLVMLRTNRKVEIERI